MEIKMKTRLTLALLGGACLLAGCGGSGSSSGPYPPANLVGNWGGGTTEYPAALSVTATGGAVSFSCGASDTLTQPLTTDAQGSFDVAATQKSSLPMVGPMTKVHLMGTVSGRTMSLHEVFASGQTGLVYTLAFGQAAPPFNGACPG